MDCIGVYLIRCKANGRIYIGSSRNIYYRFTDHKRFLKNGIHHCRKMQDDYDLFGADSFEYQIVELCSEQDKLKLEKYYMEEVYHSLNTDNGYNKLEINLDKDYIRKYSKTITDEDIFAIKMLYIVGLSKNLISKMLHKSWKLVSNIIDLNSYNEIYCELNNYMLISDGFDQAINDGISFDDFFNSSNKYGFSIDCVLHNFYCFISKLPDINIYQSDIDTILSFNSYVGRVYFCLLVMWRKMKRIFSDITYLTLRPEKIIPLTTLSLSHEDFYNIINTLLSIGKININNFGYYIRDSFTGNEVQIVKGSIIGLYYDQLFYSNYKVCGICDKLFINKSNYKYCNDCNQLIINMKKEHNISYFKYKNLIPKYNSSLKYIRECRFCGKLFHTCGKYSLFCKEHRGYIKMKERKATANLQHE